MERERNRSEESMGHFNARDNRLWRPTLEKAGPEILTKRKKEKNYLQQLV